MRIYCFNCPEVHDIVKYLDLRIININNPSLNEFKKLINRETIIFNQINSLAFGENENNKEYFEYLRTLDIGKYSLSIYNSHDPRAADYIKTTLSSVIEKNQKDKNYINLKKLNSKLPLREDIFIDLRDRIVKLYNKGDILDEDDIKRREMNANKCFYLSAEALTKKISITIISKQDTIFTKERNLLSI